MARGYRVTVYCRDRQPEPSYRGVSLVYLPTWRHKYFDTIVHTFFSTLHLLFHRPRVALYCNGANAVFTLWPRVCGVPVALNVDGLERKRKKWNRLAKAWYLLSEYLAVIFPTAVVTDAEKIRDYYLNRYSKSTIFIPYGAEVGKVDTADVLAQLGLERDKYFLYVSRMEPENNALLVREAFEKTGADMKLALIGDAPYAQDYIQRVRGTRDARVVIPGAIFPNAGTRLTDNTTYPSIVEDSLFTYKYLRILPCDVMLGSHTAFYHMQEKYAKLGKGPNPFIDGQPSCLAQIDGWEQSFRKRLADDQKRTAAAAKER